MLDDARADCARAADVMRDFASETHRAFAFGHESFATESFEEPAQSVNFDRGVDVFGALLQDWRGRTPLAGSSAGSERQMGLGCLDGVRTLPFRRKHSSPSTDRRDHMSKLREASRGAGQPFAILRTMAEGSVL